MFDTRNQFRPILAALAVVGVLSAGCSGDRPSVEAERVAVAPTVAPFVGLEPSNGASGSSTSAEQAGPAQAVEPPTGGAPVFDGDVQILSIELIDTLPHDPLAYTQGLLIDDGAFLESTGQRYESTVRRVDIATGEVLQVASTPDGFFGEGLTKVGDELIQLTWRDQQAIYWDVDTLEITRRVGYVGEGWGICYDGERLIMSDGSQFLAVRDPDTFEIIETVRVTWNGQDVHNVNELECIDGKLWANVWQTDLILRIDASSGVVEAAADARQLGQPRTEDFGVLNGIAYDPTTDTFLVTGKYWPTMHRVRFFPATAEGT